MVGQRLLDVLLGVEVGHQAAALIGFPRIMGSAFSNGRNAQTAQTPLSILPFLGFCGLCGLCGFWVQRMLGFTFQRRAGLPPWAHS
jgi:hypothetical protein